MNKKTPELGGSGEEMIEEQIDLMISAADGSNGQKAHPNIVADSLSKLLEGHHKVTAKPY